MKTCRACATTFPEGLTCPGCGAFVPDLVGLVDDPGTGSADSVPDLVHGGVNDGPPAAVPDPVPDAVPGAPSWAAAPAPPTPASRPSWIDAPTPAQAAPPPPPPAAPPASRPSWTDAPRPVDAPPTRPTWTSAPVAPVAPAAPARPVDAPPSRPSWTSASAGVPAPPLTPTAPAPGTPGTAPAKPIGLIVGGVAAALIVVLALGAILLRRSPSPGPVAADIVGTCFTYDATHDRVAAPVPCDGPHDAKVVASVATKAMCPAGTTDVLTTTDDPSGSAGILCVTRA